VPAGLQNPLRAVDDDQERAEMVQPRSGKLYTSEGHSVVKGIVTLLLVA